MQPTLNGFTATGATLWALVEEALHGLRAGAPDGGPGWTRTERFDVEAKFDHAELPHPEELTMEQRKGALKAFLRERFGLRVHSERRVIPVFGLQVADGGLKPRESQSRVNGAAGVTGTESLVTVSQNGRLEGESFSLGRLARPLQGPLQHIVVDQTGLQGSYDFALHWTPDNAARA